ncbi:MAG: hypothetical protein U0163_17775 [Gemmatimonadaceae bacterium]
MRSVAERCLRGETLIPSRIAPQPSASPAHQPQVDVWQLHAWLIEEERRANGQLEQALTVFLAGAECPLYLHVL